jgi:hypothetical protein
MREATGRAILRAIFEEEGLSIVEDVPVAFGEHEVVLDGWDAARRVGFEVLTSEAGDREAFPPPVVAAVEDAMRRGEAWVLLVDLDPTEELLRSAARGFVGQLRARGLLA